MNASGGNPHDMKRGRTVRINKDTIPLALQASGTWKNRADRCLRPFFSLQLLHLGFGLVRRFWTCAMVLDLCVGFGLVRRFQSCAATECPEGIFIAFSFLPVACLCLCRCCLVFVCAPRVLPRPFHFTCLFFAVHP